MTTVKDIYDFIDTLAPFKNAEDFDNVGILIGNPNQEVTGVVVTLDLTEETIFEAYQCSYNTIVTHHPIIYNPLKSVLATDLVYKAIKQGISVISAHTNLDKSESGVNFALASALGLKNVRPMDVSNSNVNKDIGYGCVGELATPIPTDALADYIKESLSAQVVRYNEQQKMITTVAVCGGSGGMFLQNAIESGAQCLVTGDVKHDVFLSAKEANFIVLDAGHFATEAIVIPKLVEILKQNFCQTKIKSSDYNLPVIKTI